MSFKRVVSMFPIFERSRAAILLSCLVFLAAPAWGAVAFVQKVPNTTTATQQSGTSGTIAITPTAGNLLVVVVTVAGATSPTQTVTVSDSDSVSYTQAGSAPTSGGFGRASIFYRPNVTSGAKTITITPSSSATWAVEVMEYFGVDTIPAVATNSASGSSTAPSVSVTPTAGASLYIGAVGMGKANPTSFTPGAGWTERYDDPSGASAANASEEITLATGTQTATWTLGASTSWVAVIATFSAGCTYNFRKSITVNSGQVSGGPHTNYPLLVSFTDASLKTTANGGNVTDASGDDIIFRASDGITQLDHEIEKYTATTGELVAWVRVPSINVGTVIYMDYGNSCVISPTQNPTGVWDANFKGVWHLKEATAANRLDSTSNNNILADPTSTAGVAGKIAGAADFVPTDYLTLNPAVVAVDATSTGLTTSASLNISHAVSGTNRLMVVGVSITKETGGAPSVSSITYNGVALSPVGSRATSDNKGRIEIWQLVAPATGTNNVVVTLSAAPDDATVGVMTFTGVDQSTPLGAFASATADSGTASVTVASAANELVFDTLVVEGSADKALAPGAGQTERWDLYQAPRANGGGSTEAGAASVVMSWTFATDKWAIGGVSIKPAAASTSLDLGTQFTLEAWVKGDEVINNKVILGKDGTTSNASYKLRFSSDRFTVMTSFDGTATNNLNQSGSSVAGTWYHVVGVYNSPNMDLYINGALNRSLATSGGSVFSGTSPFNIGSQGNGTQPFDGIIDEVRVSNVARSAGWILTESNNQTAPGSFYAVGNQVGPGSFNAYETANYKGAITGVIMTKIAGATVSLDMIALNAGKNAIDNTTTTWSNKTVKVEVLNTSDNSGALDANNCRSSWVSLSSVNKTFPTCSSPNCGRTTISLAMPANTYPNARLKISYPTSSPTSIGCSTDNFAIRPNTFAGTTTPYSVTDTDWQTAGTVRTLNTVTVPDTPNHKAGRPFTVRATAVNAAGTPATTTNYTGTPTPTLTSCGGAGAACTSTFGTFTLGASFAAGVLTSNVATYDNVGSFALQLVDSTFSSVDAVAGDTPANCTSQYVCSATLTVGRFLPDHFAVSYNTPVFGTACGSFTYIGQAFNYTTAPVITVTAQNLTNGTTTLYTGALWRITNGSLSGKAYTAASGTLDTSGITGTDPVIADSGGGIGTLTFKSGTGGLLFTRTTPVTLFDADISLAINVIDVAGVVYESPPGTNANPARFGTATAGNGIAFSGGKPMRFGQLALGNALGSELLNLPIPIQTQYWNGTSFLTNTLDSCTTITASNIALSNYQGALNSGNLPSGNISISGAFNAGVGNLKLTKPSSAVNGSVDLCVDLGGDATCVATSAGMSYLQGVWSGTTYTIDPRARAAFGFSKGSYSGGGLDPFVYQRENY